MAINRNSLVSAIIQSYKRQDFDAYQELLSIYYKMLDQEEINDAYLGEFTSYDAISEDAKNYLLARV